MPKFRTAVVLVWIVASVAYAQAPPAGAGAQGRVLGEVTSIDSLGKQITVKVDQGGSVIVYLQEKTTVLRVPPGEKDLRKAVRIAGTDLSVGDRVYARGRMAEGQKGIEAATVIVMTKADLAQKHEKERAEWQSRGLSGTITALSPQTKEITVDTHRMVGVRSVIVEAPDKATFRRYAPDSVRFSDAKLSSFAELRVGDQVRVLGDKNTDGTRVTAQEVVSGSFLTIAGTVKSIDTTAGEIHITNLATKKPLTVRINTSTTMRRLPPMLAMMLARRLRGGEAGPPPGAGVRQVRTPAGPPSEHGERAGAMRPGQGHIDFQQVLERVPALTLSELKPGDAIILSSTKGVDPSRVTAITVVAGVEPLLTATPQGGQSIGGAWTFDIGMPE